MSDLIDRLRTNPNYKHWLCIAEAADEIERLNAELFTMRNVFHQQDEKIERLTAELASKHEWCVNTDLANAELKSYAEEEGERSEKQAKICIELQARVEVLEGVIYRNCDPMAAIDDDARIIDEIAANEQEGE